ncbi:hypothetical protein [Microseira sp. BLCC-F43]|uniref:hypothetical protein n=1 Tax=Microseira sp. BLCC-F43 TaxID=3153602 RepID=UPI0035B87795
MTHSTKRWLAALVFELLILPFLFYGYLYLLRPPRNDLKTTLFQGIIYQGEIDAKALYASHRQY